MLLYYHIDSYTMGGLLATQSTQAAAPEQVAQPIPVDLNEVNRELSKAVQAGNLDDVKRYHQLGGDLNMICDIDDYYEKSENHGSSEKIRLVCIAIENDDIDIVKYLVANGVRINVEPDYETGAVHRNHPIICAIFENRLDIFKYFVESYGFAVLDRDFESELNHPILVEVVWSGTYDMFKYIVDECQYEGCPTIKSLNDIMAGAIECRDRLITEYIFSNGGDVNMVDADNSTPLINIIEDHICVMECINGDDDDEADEANGANDANDANEANDANVEDEANEETPEASDEYRERMMEINARRVKQMLLYGADPNVRNANGQTARDLAVAHNLDDIVRCIDEHEVDNLAKGVVE